MGSQVVWALYNLILGAWQELNQNERQAYLLLLNLLNVSYRFIPFDKLDVGHMLLDQFNYVRTDKRAVPGSDNLFLFI